MIMCLCCVCILIIMIEVAFEYGHVVSVLADQPYKHYFCLATIMRVSTEQKIT